MRNLALISSWDSFLPASSSITATTIDLDENVIYVASEHNTLDGQVKVGVWKMSQTNWVIVHRNISCISISNYSLKTPLEQISIFQSVVSSNAPSNGQIISFRFMAESRRIAAIMRGGDVVMISIEEEGAPVRRSSSCSSLFVLIPL
jgi:elongator complex protein 1